MTDTSSNLFETGIRPTVDKWLIDKSKELRDYGSYWSASSGGYCMRKVMFERLGVPPVSEDARKQRVFSSGDIFHEWLQRITKESGLSIAQELELQDEELMIRGHIDDLVLITVHPASDPPENAPSGQIPYEGESKLILYDYKTVHSYSFKYKKDKMSRYHRYQLGTYMYMLRKGSKKEWTVLPTESLTEARILNISKDDLRMSENQLMWTPELEKDILDYWTTLNKYWKAKKLPPCTCADHELNSKTGVGFMADPRYNPYFYKGEPCSLEYYSQWKETKIKEKV